MTVTATHLTTNFDNTDGSSYATASISPGANALILAWIATDRSGAGEPNAPTATGCGLTWVAVASAAFAGFSPKITLFRAMGASPTPGAVTFDFASQTQVHAIWSITQFDGTDTTGTNGSGAIVQAVADLTTSSVSTFTITLAAFANSTNATAGGFVEAAGTADFTAGSGFTILGQAATTDSGLKAATEWRPDNDTTVDITSGNAQSFYGVAVEIQAAPVGPPVDTDYLLTFVVQR